MMISPDIRRIASVACPAAALTVLILTVTPAAAQDALGGGRALDANLSATDGRINRSTPSQNFGSRNRLVTGNVVAGRGFRESVGYTAAYDFRGDTGSDDLFEFRADSALSNPQFINYGGTYQQLRFGQELGLIVGFEQASTGVVVQDVLTGRLPAYRTTQAEWQLNRMGTIGSLSAALEREAEPLLLGSLPAVEGEDTLVHSSSLQGVYTVPVGQGAQIIGVTNYDVARAQEDLDAGIIDYQFGVRFQPRYVSTLLGETGAGPAVRVDVAYKDILQSLAARYGSVSEETDEQRRIETLEEMMGRVRDYLLETEGATEQPAEDPSETRDDGEDGGEDERDPLLQAVDVLRHGEQISALVDARTNRFEELMSRGQAFLTSGEYFRAEREFEHALRITPSHPLATVGLSHAQLGAKLYRSAATTLRTLFRASPEMIDTRYDVGIIPNESELRRITSELQESLRTTYDPLGRAFLLAYIGHQLQDRELLELGLDRMEAENKDEQDRLIPLLRVIWLDI